MISDSKSIDLIRNVGGVYRKYSMDALVGKACVYFSHRWQLFATVLHTHYNNLYIMNLANKSWKLGND